MFEVLFLPLLCTNRRSSAVERLTAVLEQILEHMTGISSHQRSRACCGCRWCVYVSGGAVTTGHVVSWLEGGGLGARYTIEKPCPADQFAFGCRSRCGGDSTEMVFSCVLTSLAALSVVGVGAFHVPVLPSTRAGVAGNGHVSRMSAADDKAKSFYPFQRSNAPSTRCVVCVLTPRLYLCCPWKAAGGPRCL